MRANYHHTENEYGPGGISFGECLRILRYGRDSTIGLRPVCAFRTIPSRAVDLGELFDSESAIFNDPERAKSVFQGQGTPMEAGHISEVMEWTDRVHIPGHSDRSSSGAVGLFLPPGHHYGNKKPVASAGSVDGTPQAPGLDEFTNILNATLRILHVGHSTAKPRGNGE